MQKLLHPDMKVSAEFGGSLLWGKRKGKRPISTSKPMHLVLKSDVAVGKLSLTRYEAMIWAVLKATAKKFHIDIRKFSINRNHLHLCIKGNDRQGITVFLRVFSGILAKKMIFLSKAKINKFWTQRIYTRIVEWGKALKHVEDYIEMNAKEAKGEVPYTPRKRQKKIFRRASKRMSPKPLGHQTN